MCATLPGHSFAFFGQIGESMRLLGQQLSHLFGYQMTLHGKIGNNLKMDKYWKIQKIEKLEIN